MDRVNDLLRRFDSSKSLRGNWESLWQEIGDRVLPQMADFDTARSDGEKRTDYMYDATPALALHKFAAAVESMTTPRNQRWHKLTTNDDALGDDPDVREYLDAVTEIMFRARYSPRASFATQTHEVYLSFGAFGTGVMMIDDDTRAQAIRYKSIPLAQAHIIENEHGAVDTLLRKFRPTIRQLAQRFGSDRLPPKLQGMLDDPTKMDERVDVVHGIYPREDWVKGAFGARGMQWLSCYVLANEKHLISESGYRVQPFAVARYQTAAGEVYGRSPAWMALSSIKVLNEQKKTHIKVGHKLADPPLLATEDGALSVYSQVPGAVNYGGLNSNGEPLVKPLQTGARLDITLEMMDAERALINDAFLVTLFQILAESPTMTATEVLERAQEKAQLLAPIMGRVQSEFLGPIIEREIDILAHAGQLPPMPDALLERNGDYQIEYTSPMARAVRASDGVAIARTLESVIPLAQIDASVLDEFDLAATAREMAKINGVPAKILRSDADKKARAQARADQQEAAQLLQAAPVVSQTASNLVQLQKQFGATA